MQCFRVGPAAPLQYRCCLAAERDETHVGEFVAYFDDGLGLAGASKAVKMKELLVGMAIPVNGMIKCFVLLLGQLVASRFGWSIAPLWEVIYNCHVAHLIYHRDAFPIERRASNPALVFLSIPFAAAALIARR